MTRNRLCLVRGSGTASGDTRETPAKAPELSSRTTVKETGLTAVNPLLNTPKKKRNQCQGCGNSDVPMEMDHTAPKSSGGRGTLPICRDCNRTKGAKDNFDLLDMRAWNGYKLNQAMHEHGIREGAT